MIILGSKSACEIFDMDFWESHPDENAITLDLTNASLELEIIYDDRSDCFTVDNRKIKGKTSKYSKGLPIQIPFLNDSKLQILKENS